MLSHPFRDSDCSSSAKINAKRAYADISCPSKPYSMLSLNRTVTLNTNTYRLQCLNEIRYVIRRLRHVNPSDYSTPIDRETPRSLPSISTFRRQVPNFLLLSQLIDTIHRPRIQDMPCARYAQTPFSIQLPLCIYYKFCIPMASYGNDPLFGCFFIGMGYRYEIDVFVLASQLPKLLKGFLGD